jgi:hypothetical protein
MLPIALYEVVCFGKHLRGATRLEHIKSTTFLRTSARYEVKSNMRVADASDRKTWKKIGIRQITRKAGLSQKVVYAILEGKPIRKQTLATFKRAIEN